MPYCPKCDMEFIAGITVCSDCGGPLVESKEIADAMKKKEQEETLARLQAEYQAQLQLEKELAAENDSISESARSDAEDPSAPHTGSSGHTPSRIPGGRYGGAPTRAYVKKSQQFDDLKSSASAFFAVGSVLLVFAVLCWLGIIKLALNAIGLIAITVLGAASLFVAFKTRRDAKNVESEISDEELRTRKLIRWFSDTYTGEQLDNQILNEYGELIPEEFSLKRFELIQDLLITNQDLSDPAYVDLLTDEIYAKLYPDT